MKVASRALLYRPHRTVAWPATPHVIGHGNDHAVIPEFHHNKHIQEKKTALPFFNLSYPFTCRL